MRPTRHIKTMSESSKMGLFGSKDKTKETEIKDDSPDRYAPYCIDSDSETYDTEALSIMDINDIIGVQSEPVSDSTLESEIAALSQIITESKTDGGQNIAESKCPAQQGKEIEDNDAVQTSTENQCLTSTVDDEKTLGVETVKGESTMIRDKVLGNQQENNDTKNNCEHNVSIDSIAVVNPKDVENADVSVKVNVEHNQSNQECILQTVISKGNVNRTVECDSGICGSLQLIGEAYSSGDSQDMKTDDVESVDTVNQNTLMSKEEKEEVNESCNSQGGTGNATTTFSKINLDETCTNKDTLIETIENFDINVDAQEVFNNSEKIEIQTECKVDSPTNIVSESIIDDVIVDTIEMDKNEIKILEEKEENIIEEKEENIIVAKQESMTVEYTEMEVEHSMQSENELLASIVQKPETEITEEKLEIQENIEHMDVDEQEEYKTEENKIDIKETSQKEKEDTNTSNIENVDKFNTIISDKMNVTVAVIAAEDDNEKVDSAQFESQNNSNESKFSDTLHIKDNPEETENMQVSEEVEGMNIEKQGSTKTVTIEKFKTIEKMNTKKLESVKDTDTKQSEIEEEIADKQFKMIEEMDIEQLEITEVMDTESSEAVEEVDTKESEIQEQNDTEQSEVSEEKDTKQLEALKEDTKQSEVLEQMSTTQLEVIEEMSNKQFETAEEINTKPSETTEKLNTKQLETTEEMNTKLSETIEEMNTKLSETIEEINTKLPEAIEGIVTEQLELSEEMDSIQPETIEETDTKQQVTTDEIDTKRPKSLEKMNIKQLETAEEMDTEKLTTLEEVDTKYSEILEEEDTKHSETVEEVNTKHSETVEEVDTKHSETVEELDTKHSETVEKVDTKHSETVEEVDTKHSETVEEMDTKHSETVEEMVTKHSETVEEVDTKHSETVEEVDTKYSETVEEIDTKHSETVEKVDTKHTETVEKVDTKHSETVEEVDTKHSETLEEMDTEHSETVEEVDTKHSETIEEVDTEHSETVEVDTKHSETIEEVDTKHSETIEEGDTKHSETVKEVDTKHSETVKEVDTKHSKTVEKVGTKHSEIVKEVDTKHSETVEEVDTKQSETVEEMDTNQNQLISAEVMDTKQLDSLEKMDTKQAKVSEEIEKRRSKATEEINTFRSEVAEKMDSKQLETIEEVSIKESKTTEEMDTRQSETIEEVDTKESETIEEVDTKESETIEEVDTKQSETADGVFIKQITKDIDTRQLEAIEEMLQESELLPSELSSPKLDTSSSIKLTTETANVIDNTVNIASSNVSRNLQTEASSNLNSVLSEVEIKASITVQSKEAVELPVEEESFKDEIKTSKKSDTASVIEVPMTMELNEEPEIHLETISNISVPMDIDTIGNSSEIKVDSLEKNNCKVETTHTEPLPIEECIPEVQSQELTEAHSTIENENSDEITVEKNEINISQVCAELEVAKVSEENRDTLINDKEKSSPKVSLQEEEEMEYETIELETPKDNDKEQKENQEEFKLMHVKTLIESDANVENDEVSDSLKSEDGVSNLEELLLLPSECREPIVPAENVEEDAEERITLNLEEVKIESKLVLYQDNFDQIVEENIINDKKEEESVYVLEKDDASIGEEVIKIEKHDTLDENIEKVINTNNTEESMLTEDVELSRKEQIESNDSKTDTNENNFKAILESANTVEEMFSGEQNDNTEDIVTSILDDVRSATDFKNILTTEAVVTDEMASVLEESASLPLVDTTMVELTEKLPESSENVMGKEMEDSMSTQNIDSLEGLLGLDLIQEGEDTTLKIVKAEKPSQEQETLSKDVDMSLLLEQSNQTTHYMTDVISSCLTDNDTTLLQENTENSNLMEVSNVIPEDSETDSLSKVKESTISESINSENVQSLQKELEANSDLPENELDMDFEEAPLETVDELEETEAKLELVSDMIPANDDPSENLSNVQTTETSQPSSEISELESAVKFLQESEEQAIDSPLILSPKMVESVVEDISKQTNTTALFVPDEDMCEDTELAEELQSIATDSISISEAEIISEAAKLESERKLAEQVKLDATRGQFDSNKEKLIAEEEGIKLLESKIKFGSVPLETMEVQQTELFVEEKIPEALHSLPLKTSETIPKVSILEERLKEPPKIEIPTTDVTKVAISPTASKDSLLIQKDAKLIAFQKMLESPKLSHQTEPKIVDTPRKDSEKHDFENVGSPRIILKIAKSAITDCAEPRSPKSPKIRSATNSPNPEDSPGQKLGKIKLKLSKGGHPSIISNENIEEVGQWYSEGTLSLSPIGMKIKLSKSGDASIVSSDKHEAGDDSKEGKHKFEEAKRTESPIGMKIKLSKTGDASIVQQDSKDVQMKHKDKLDIVQGSPKRTESPIGMKIKLSKSGDASIISTERQDIPEEHRESQVRPKETSYDSPKRTDSPIGMKIKLFKTGDASIVSPDVPEEGKDNKMKDKLESSPEAPKRTDSPIGMKIKLAKTKGGASIIPMEAPEDANQKLEVPDVPKRTESPFGMKIKLSKTGDASIVHSEISDESKDIKLKEKAEAKEKQDASQDTVKISDSLGMKIKVIKSGDTSVIASECSEEPEVCQESLQKVESPIGMKIKLSKFGEPSIVPTEKQEQLEESNRPLLETPKRTESPIGMKIKLSKTGDASIIQPEIAAEDASKTSRVSDAEHPKTSDSTLGMKIKLLKTGDASIVDPDKKERQQRRRDTESPLEMKIKLSKTGHPTIVACDNHGEASYRPKELADQHSFGQRYKEQTQTHKETALKFLKAGHPTILQSNRSELTIEPVQMQGKKADSTIEISPKRKDITVSPIEPKKSKLETQLTQILPEVTIQPVTSRNQKQFMFDPKSSAISLQQMNVISQEISITQVRPSKSQDSLMNDKLKDMLNKNSTSSPMNSDCEIIEHRPELIIVNENSNSSQDVVIIEEVSPTRIPEVKVPKRRGRPRRNPLAQPTVHPPTHMLLSRDPLTLDEAQQMQQQQLQAPQVESRENERPKRTCRSQKSYAPPKRGRGRGRGKRKLDNTDTQMNKKVRIEQDLTAIEASTTAVITIDCPPGQEESCAKPSELYKALKQPAVDTKVVGRAEKKSTGQKNDASKIANATISDSTNVIIDTNKQIQEVDLDPSSDISKSATSESKDNVKDKKQVEVVSEKMQKTALKQTPDEKSDKTTENAKSENKDMLVPPEHQNWLTPTSKRLPEATGKHENVSTVQVIDEETRMSAESGSRSQTPARNISAPASETMVNEESQGSVLSTATTESEKVKVKNRRMEINFDPDEGPFTVDKIAEYEWPLDHKGETFMIQEQISQYLGVKSFKRKYPDLKRRVVDMEERNYLRENGLVSEAMCDMGLTAICSSEVLDVMCSDFPDQYEEYRKHMREKQVKEHSKKQKELSAAANAEKNRIDLAEMAVQSALSWNIRLNKARRENRKCSLDLQTFTIHVPKKQQKVETERKIGHYPVALIPGQYTDYYREYTPAELRYYPLNTVLYGPMRPNERKFDSQSEGSQSDSDSDSSSDDSSSSSSEGTQDTEGSQSTMDDVDMEIVNPKEEVKLKCKMCLKVLNKHSKNEVLVQCGTCSGHVHPSCIDLTLDMVPHIQSYAWQCTDCKTCAQCHDPADEDKMLFCDMCDRGYHIYCVGLRRVPQGRWHCQECAVCANCGSREPGGANSDRNSVAQWQHEYKKGDKNTRVYVSTLCVPCSKLWRKGRYCPHCSRCHTAPRLDLEANLVHCSACDKYLHLGCVETKGVPLDRKNYLCDFCAPNRQQMIKPLVSKTLKM
ncbi:PHD finger protein enhancer of yellow 3 isoform X1 [Megalopta genalis]|uniref:PHD finger protein enhancer of yellow 3 isoform X1 n=1 Tax=Megalopta genalis TaxID=115081 RepID=UPI003FD3112E